MFCVSVPPGSAESEVSEELKKEKIMKLKKKEKALQDLLTQKLNELKTICVREAVSAWPQSSWRQAGFGIGAQVCLSVLCRS